MGSARPDQLNIPLPLSSPPHSNSYYSSDEDDDDPEESVFIDEYGQRLIRIREPPRPRRRRERHPEPEPMLPDLDYYQHPEKRWVVAEGRDRGRGIGYSRGHDIYSLGCVLLELGLWNTLDKLVEVEDEDFERVRRGFQSLTMSLDGYVPFYFVQPYFPIAAFNSLLLFVTFVESEMILREKTNEKQNTESQDRSIAMW